MSRIKKEVNVEVIESKDEKKLPKISNTDTAPLGLERTKKFPFNIIDKIIYKFKYWRTNPPDKLIVNMELRNGEHTSFYVETSNNGFEYRNGIYLFDDALKYYHQASRHFMLDYHQDFNMPVARRIPVNDIRKVIKESGVTDVELATNPENLQNFIDSKIISQVITSGSQIESFLQSMKKMMFIAIVIGAIHLFLYLMTSGILQRLTGK